MRSRRVGIWTLGLSLVIAGGALLYRELTGTTVAIAKYWPLTLVALGIEMIVAQIAAGRPTGQPTRVRVSGLAILGLIILLATAPAIDGPWGINCGPVGTSCTDGSWPSVVDHQLERRPLTVDWAGVTTLETSIRFGSIRVAAVGDGTIPQATVQVTGHGATVAAARAVAESAAVNVQRLGDRLVLTGTYTKGTGTSSDYADIDLTLEVPAAVAVRIDSEYGWVDVQGVKTQVEVETRMGAISIADSARVSVESEHGRIEVLRTAGPADVTGTFGAITVNQVTGPLAIESKHGAVDVRGAADSLAVTATYGTVNVRYTATPGGPCTLVNTYGSLTLEHPADSAYQLDAAAERSRITTNLPGVTVTTSGSSSAAQATIKGGGPLISLRNAYGRIDIRAY